MKYVFLLCLIGIASASVLYDHRVPKVTVSKIDQDEVTKKIIDKFNEAVDAIIERLENHKIISYDIMKKLIEQINALREKNVSWLNLLNEKIKTIRSTLRDHLKTLIEWIKDFIGQSEVSAKKIDQDEVTKKIIEKFNEIVDIIIKRLENHKIISFDIIKKVIEHINALREKNISWLNLINEKIKTIRGELRDNIMSLIEKIKNVIGGSDVALKKIDQDEVTQKIINQFNKLFDTIIERLETQKIISFEYIRVFLDQIKLLREKNVDWINLINEKIKSIRGDLRNKVMAVINFIRGFLGRSDVSVKKIDQDEVTQKLIERFNEIVDKIIERLEDQKVISLEFMKIIVGHINHLREKNVDWINLLNEKIKMIQGTLRVKIDTIFDIIKNLVTRKVEPTQNIDIDKLIEKKEKAKEKFIKAFDKVIEDMRNKNFPASEHVAELMDIIKECVQLGLDVEKMAVDRVRSVVGKASTLIKKILEYLFGWKI